MNLTRNMETAARDAAFDAYTHDRYGNGVHDWQSAEVAAAEKLHTLGMDEDESYEWGHEIGCRVSSALDTVAGWMGDDKPTWQSICDWLTEEPA